MKIYNQLAYKGVKFGTKKTSDIGAYGCKLCCFATILQKDPVEVDKLFCEKNVYFGTAGDLIDDTAAAKALGWEFKGRETDINKMPDWEPTIKEVDFSAAPGKSQHFVVRMKESILDPYEGVERKKNFYEEKSGNFCSYRLFVVKNANPVEVPTVEERTAVSKLPMLKKMAEAIKKHEGWFEGSRSFRNNNPGNLVFTDYTKNSLGAVRVEAGEGGRFAVWNTPEDGFLGLEVFIYHSATDQLKAYNSGMTLFDYFAVYAPSSDGNTPKKYAEAVIADMGVANDFKLKDLLKESEPVPTPTPEPPSNPDDGDRKNVKAVLEYFGKKLGLSMGEKVDDKDVDAIKGYVEKIEGERDQAKEATKVAQEGLDSANKKIKEAMDILQS